MADNKANIMITVNSIIVSILVSILIRKFEEFPNLIVPTVILTMVCLITIVFAVLATRPNVSSGRFTREDVQAKRTNLLFFGNFHNMTLEDYEEGVREMMTDSEFLYGSMTRDIYFQGKVLGRKYKLLRISYTVFMFGFVLAVFSFGIAIFFFPWLTDLCPCRKRLRLIQQYHNLNMKKTLLLLTVLLLMFFPVLAQTDQRLLANGGQCRS
jgi:hypothetical protein